MPLVIEDGTGKADANTYVSLAEARAYALDRGVALSAVDVTLTPLLIKATDYLEALDSQYVGTVASTTQALQWPRTDVVTPNGDDFPEDEIPAVLKIAQIRLVMEQAAGVNIMPTTTGKFVKRRKVGPIETEYSEGVNVDGLPSFPHITNILSSIIDSSVGFALTTVRI